MKCFNCNKNGLNMYGYYICDSCKSKIRLFKPETIKKYYSKNPQRFKKGIQARLDILEKDYIKKN